MKSHSNDHCPAAEPKAATTHAASLTRLSDEQQSVVESNSQICIVNAFAGTGKTSTANAVAQAYPEEKFLYLCLNKANQLEAAARFPSNVKPMTTHAVALAGIGSRLGSRTRITTEWRPLTLRQEQGIPSNRGAALAQSVLKAFFKSADSEITEAHASTVTEEWGASDDETLSSLAYAKLAWTQMQDADSKSSIPHDAYLKMFALSSPRLPYDRIIFDEAQDANPVTAQIISEQARNNGARVLCIGDRHQGIYSFRGSINAMEEFSAMPGADLHHLTKTWRFGPEIADLANAVLSELKGEMNPIVGMGTQGAWTRQHFTLLARTNAHLIKEAADRSGKGIHWLGGPDSYRISVVNDAYYLFANQHSCIQDRFLTNFRSWGEFEEYAENARDQEARILLSIIGQHQHDTPHLIRDIRANAVADPQQASLILTTAHKSKGLDWDCVQIGDDFELLDDVEKTFIDHPNQPLSTEQIQEVNLLYVAMTRARKSLVLNPETRDWLANLEAHKANRMVAADGLQRSLRSAGGQ